MLGFIHVSSQKNFFSVNSPDTQETRYGPNNFGFS